MKKQKKERLLTAKQRKELRATAEPKQNKAAAIEDAPIPESVPEQSEAVVKTGILGFSFKQFAIMAGAVLLALVLILFGILLPTVIIPRAVYGNVANPVAVITLSTGDELEFEIFETETPIAATNFIYYARKGFFDDSIIFDRQGSFFRFGQYTGESDGKSVSKLFAENNTPKFNKKFKDMRNGPDNGGNFDDKFDYILKSDTTSGTRAGNFSESGYISLMTNLGSVDYQICAHTDEALPEVQNENNTKPTTVSPSACGKYLNPGTLGKIQKLYARMESTHTVGKEINWRRPDEVIRIKKIKLYNLDKNVWKNFDMNAFIRENNNGAWVGG
ncbi:MAG: peptidylprolyl isomerase [Clostridiales bacterium]|jgi:cyclophilin family peptidyl-prolyl cis-trans isomerase|nr:peptidylprolyl isomerase [Clostridiales bacterium]